MKARFHSSEIGARIARHNRLGHVVQQTFANVLSVLIVSLVCVAVFS